MPERATWASKAGFVLASAGAAVGLGAIWKFPWLAGSNGGAVFVIPYVILSLTLGFVFLTAEITLGYMGRGSIVTTMRKLGGSKWVPAGYLGVVTGLLVLSFYSVIGGWTIAYLVDAILGRGLVTSQAELGARFGALSGDPLLAVGYQALFLTLTAGVVALKVSKGIERLSRILMPALFILMLILIVRGLTLPGASEGLSYLFAWKPEAFTWQSLYQALGFTFFSLCVGCGCMMTYAAGEPHSEVLRTDRGTHDRGIDPRRSDGDAGGVRFPSRSGCGSRPYLRHDAGDFRSAPVWRTVRCGVLCLPHVRGAHELGLDAGT